MNGSTELLRELLTVKSELRSVNSNDNIASYPVGNDSFTDVLKKPTPLVPPVDTSISLEISNAFCISDCEAGVACPGFSLPDEGAYLEVGGRPSVRSRS